MNTIKCVICGQGAVGKSTLIKRLIQDKFDDSIEMTPGLDVEKLPIKDGEEDLIELQIWDLGGQEHFRFFQQDFFKGAKVIILVYSVEWFHSLLNLNDWVELIPNTLDNYEFILVANKIDEINRAIDQEMGKEFASKYNMKYIEVSAKTGENIISLKEELRRIIGKIKTERKLIVS